MTDTTLDISIWKLGLSFSLLIIPFLLFVYYKIPLIKGTIIGAIRMVIQLSLIAIYLEWIFDVNNLYINALWVIVMIFVGVFTIINRSQLNWKTFIVPFFLSSITAVAFVDTLFLGLVIDLNYHMDARYLIPITGMILGNSMNNNIIGLTVYFKGLKEKQELYYFLQINTSSKKLALRPFISEAIRQSLNPMVATMSVIGLISLPGMMTGQILSGTSPVTAIKYQIMIMLAIFVGCSINIFLSLKFSNWKVIKNGNLDLKQVFKK